MDGERIVMTFMQMFVEPFFMGVPNAMPLFVP